MTTPTPTSDLPGSSVPQGLPDEATLTRMASELFRAWGDTSAAPAGIGQAAAVEPTDAPISAGGMPASTAAVAAPPRTVTSVPGLPTEYAAAVPQILTRSPDLPSGTPFLPSSPYYFLGESSAYPSLAASVPGQEGQENRVAAQSFALPGEAELGGLLAELFSPPATVPPGINASPQKFYFLDSQTAAANLPPNAATFGEAHPAFDVQAVRRDFPILAERINGRPLVWLDNAATTQKPQAVIDRLDYFYRHENSNIHRAAHELAARATDAYESARSKVARFLGAGSADEIVFVRGATEAINLVAQTFGRQHIGAGDEIVVSLLEHHANIVPWQQIAAEKGAKIRVIPVDDSGQILLEEYRKLLTDKTKLVAISQVSNALGTITPVQEIVDLAHRVGARVLVDGAQSVSHLRVNVSSMDADFFVLSGHKLFAPTGIGVLYGKKDLLDSLPPWQGGGNMIADVTFERTIYQPAPARFEAGTGNIADAVGLGAAIDYLERIGLENIGRYEHGLLAYATRALQSIPGLRLIGTARDKASVLSFVLDGYRPEEVGKALNAEGIAVRSGHHCAQPILRRFGLEATVRPSLAFYNTCEEVDALVAVVRRLSSGKG
jgi:cysteine desulfurase/selenocysteine lyase